MMRWCGRSLLAGVLSAWTAGCGGSQSILGSQSPGASDVESLWWVAIVSTGLLALLVIGGLFYGIRRARRAYRSTYREPIEEEAALVAEGEARLPPGDLRLEASIREQRLILGAGAVLPVLFLVGFLAFSIRTGASVAEAPAEPAFTIDVVGHQFWWEVHYPDHAIITANEIHIPTDRVVRVRVTSADVIHSFWIPQLSPGKIDMVPGRTNTLWMLAVEPGVYRGQCTEFCGMQHAKMSLSVTAHEPDGFDDWIDARRAPLSPPTPQELQGRAVFFEAGCAACHAIRGIREPGPSGLAGPDLTHLGSRATLGALTVPNDRPHLTAWIVNPHQFKAGVLMPAMGVAGDDLAALIAFLETLQ